MKCEEMPHSYLEIFGLYSWR